MGRDPIFFLKIRLIAFCNICAEVKVKYYTFENEVFMFKRKMRKSSFLATADKNFSAPRLKVSLSVMWLLGGDVLCNWLEPLAHTLTHICQLNWTLTALDKQRWLAHLHVFFLQDRGLLGKDMIGLDALQALLPVLILHRKWLLTPHWSCILQQRYNNNYYYDLICNAIFHES